MWQTIHKPYTNYTKAILNLYLYRYGLCMLLECIKWAFWIESPKRGRNHYKKGLGFERFEVWRVWGLKGLRFEGFGVWRVWGLKGLRFRKYGISPTLFKSLVSGVNCFESANGKFQHGGWYIPTCRKKLRYFCRKGVNLLITVPEISKSILEGIGRITNNHEK